MAQQQAKKSILDQFRSRVDAALEQAAEKPFVPPNQNVIPGLTNAVARLTEIEFNTVRKEGPNKGKPYFQARATILDPETVLYKGAVTTVRGMTTRQYVQIEDKKFGDGEKTVEDCIEQITMLLKGLGVQVKKDDDLEALVEVLNETTPKPLFRVTTEGGKKKDPKTREWVEDPTKVREIWGGQNGLEGYSAPDASTTVTPGTGGRSARGTAAAANGHAAQSTTSKAATPTPSRASTAATPPPKASFRPGTRGVSPLPPKEPDYAEETDLDVLAEAAKAGNELAQARLDEIAAEVGIDLQSAEWVNVEWLEIPAAIREAQEQGEPAGEEDTGHQPLLAVNNVVDYKQGPRARPLQCKVLRAHPDGSADLQTIKPPIKVFKGVTADQVQGVNF